MRKPTQIPGLSNIQIQAYYKSFLHTLDNSRCDLTDFEASFVESNLGRTRPFSPAQISVIENMMDKYPNTTPKFAHYDTEKQAETFFTCDPEAKQTFFEKEG